FPWTVLDHSLLLTPLESETQSRVEHPFAWELCIRSDRVQTIILVGGIEQADGEVAALWREAVSAEQIELRQSFVGHIRHGGWIRSGARSVLEVPFPACLREKS